MHGTQRPPCLDHSRRYANPLFSFTTTPDPDKWREIMMQNAKLLYATGDDSDGGDQKEEL